MQLGELGIPRINIEPLLQIDNLGIRAFKQYINIVNKTDIGHAVSKSLAEDPRVIALNGQMVSTGNAAGRFEIWQLAMWYLWCINEHGKDKAKIYLDLFLDSDKISVMNTLWILGIEVSEPIVLHDEFILQPLDRMPDSNDKEYFLQVVFGHHLDAKLTPKCAITKLCQIKKVTTETLLLSKDYQKEYWEVSRRLHDIAMLINVLHGVSCLPYYSTSYVDSTTPLGIFGGSGGGMPIYDVTSHNCAKLPVESKTSLDTLITNFNDLCDDERKRFRIILSRLSQAKRGTQIEDRILDLCIALEMMLLTDNPNNEQLSLTFRVRGSWLIGKDDPEYRYAKYKQLKDIYKYRSQVAHSGKLEGDAHKLSTILDSLSEYQSLAEDICQSLISEGPPDWVKLILDVK